MYLSVRLYGDDVPTFAVARLL